jgi:outer membrane protein assembly factor BamB
MSDRPGPVFIGINGAVLALDRETGETRWRTELKGSDFVNVTVQDGDLFATSRGEVYRLNPTSGDIMWHNNLPGDGWGIATVAGAPQTPAVENKNRDDAGAAAAVTVPAT